MDRKFYEYALKKIREGDKEYLEKLLNELEQDIEIQYKREYDLRFKKYKEFADDFAQLKKPAKTTYRYNEIAFYLNLIRNKPVYSPQKIVLLMKCIQCAQREPQNGSNKAVIDAIGDVFANVKIVYNPRTNVRNLVF